MDFDIFRKLEICYHLIHVKFGEYGVNNSGKGVKTYKYGVPAIPAI